MRKLAIIGILGCLLFSSVEGAVLRVEKDGTGDYTVIQDAVDAAEDGDTVLIGPGRYTEVHDFEYYYGRITQVCITLEKSLSIIGAGRGVTVIEPVDAAKTQSDPGGIASRSSDLDVFLSDFTIENTPGHAILYDMDSGGRVEITRVGISNCFSGINVKRTMNSHIFECDIQTTIHRGIWAWRVDGLLVENCSFQDDGIEFYEAQRSAISNCRTDNSEVGIALGFCGSTTVSQCLLLNSGYNSLFIWGGCDILVHDIEAIDQSDAGLTIKNYHGMSDIEIRDSVFKAGAVSCYFYDPFPGFVFRNNHILPSDEGCSIWALNHYTGPDTWIDMTGNYWGTDDPQEVAASIHDGHDDEACSVFIDFEPMAGGPVSTTRTSLGGLKALYR